MKEKDREKISLALSKARDWKTIAIEQAEKESPEETEKT